MKIFPKAIVFGFLANLFAAFIATLVIGIVFGTDVANQKVIVSALIFSVISGILGGYTTSHYAPSSKFYNTFLLGAIGILTALVLILIISYPLWFNVISIALTIPANLTGAYINHSQRRAD